MSSGNKKICVALISQPVVVARSQRVRLVESGERGSIEVHSDFFFRKSSSDYVWSSQGIIGAISIGFLCFLQPLFGDIKSSTWAKLLLVLASIVYVTFSSIWDKHFLKLTLLQLFVALFLLSLTLLSGMVFFIALGLLAHALWDLWHLTTGKKYVPWWYAGACFYVDLVAVLIIWVKGY